METLTLKPKAVVDFFLSVRISRIGLGIRFETEVCILIYSILYIFVLTL